MVLIIPNLLNQLGEAFSALQACNAILWMQQWEMIIDCDFKESLVMHEHLVLALSVRYEQLWS
jgi:hypothetical protein